MAEEEDPKEGPTFKSKMNVFMRRVKESDQTKKGMDYVLFHRLEFLFGALMFVGIVLAFFYLHVGGAFVGLGIGLCFYREIMNYFARLRVYYMAAGIFKTVMAIALVVYLFLAIPIFLVATVVGVVVMYIIEKIAT